MTYDAWLERICTDTYKEEDYDNNDDILDHDPQLANNFSGVN